MRVLSAALLTAASLLVAEAARAQWMHPLPRPVRPPHERLAAADVVAVATVLDVAPDRYRLAEARALIGAVDATFEVKRSPSASLPLDPGSRVLLFLRGARSPYLAIDRAAELPVLGGEAQERAWASALRRLRRAGGDARARAALYADWIDGDDASLRAIGAAALRDPSAELAALGDGFFVPRARAVFDPARPLEVRHAWAEVVLWSRAGSIVLADGVLPCRPGSDPDVLLAAVNGARLHGLPKLDALLECAREHEAERVRRAASRAPRPKRAMR